jgi:hypothetical protein
MMVMLPLDGVEHGGVSLNINDGKPSALVEPIGPAGLKFNLSKTPGPVIVSAWNPDTNIVPGVLLLIVIVIPLLSVPV